MAIVPLTYWWPHSDGTLHRWMRDQAPSDAPGPPTALAVSQSPTATTADLTWAAPATDGGSPVTAYVVTPPTGSPVTLGPTTFAYHVTGLTRGVPATFRVAAVNGDGRTGAAASVTSSFALFPGHTLAKVTASVLLGADEADKNMAVQSGDERAAPQTLAGTPPAAVRYYYNSWSDFAVPSGSWTRDVQSQYAKGRICWASFSIGENWAQAIDGRHNAAADALIAWAEESAPDVPIPLSPKHEPDFSATAGFTASDFGRFGRWFRSRMDLYAAAHGGIGVYQWKHLSWGPIHTAQDYTQTSPTGPHGPVQPSWEGAALITATASASTDTFTSAGHLLSNGRKVTLLAPPAGLTTTATYYVISATANTFQLSATLGGSAVNVTADATGITVISRDCYDWMAADPYVSRGSGITPAWTANMLATVRWCETAPHVYPFAFSEFAVGNADPDAATKLQTVYDDLLNGSHDVWAVLYYNSGDQSYVDHTTGAKGPLYYSLYLDNGAPGRSNGRLLDRYVALLQDPRSVHFWDLTAPDGHRYARPPGV